MGVLDEVEKLFKAENGEGVKTVIIDNKETGNTKEITCLSRDDGNTTPNADEFNEQETDEQDMDNDIKNFYDEFDCQADKVTRATLAVSELDDIMIVKRDGKVVVRDLENQPSPFVRFFQSIIHFFVSKKKNKAETQKGDAE